MESKLESLEEWMKDRKKGGRTLTQGQEIREAGSIRGRRRRRRR